MVHNEADGQSGYGQLMVSHNNVETEIITEK